VAGPNRKAKEEKLYRDLMKYEGLGEDLCDLLRDVDRISAMVKQSKARTATGGWHWSAGHGGLGLRE
jgi:hypothetical protein